MGESERADEEEVLVDGLGALLGKTGGRAWSQAAVSEANAPPTQGTDTEPHMLSKVGQDSTSTAASAPSSQKLASKQKLG